MTNKVIKLRKTICKRADDKDRDCPFVCDYNRYRNDKCLLLREYLSVTRFGENKKICKYGEIKLNEQE
jgi:hypothetical protein